MARIQRGENAGVGSEKAEVKFCQKNLCQTLIEHKNRQRIETIDPELQIVVTDDGSRTLYSRRYAQCFHSESGAAAEATLVFVENSGVAIRLEQKLPSKILEIGFGSGLNFVLSAVLANRFATNLEYLAIDQKMICGEVLSQMEFESLPAVAENGASKYVSDWAAGWREIDVGTSANWNATKLGAFAELNLVICAFADFDLDQSNFDAIYFDAFSPEANGELWGASVIRRLHDRLKIGGRLVTYCVKSEIQKRLRECGFLVKKTRGPVGGKREVLIAEKQ